MEFEDCVGVVTRGATGVGRALAREAARLGATVVIADIADAAETVALIEAAGGKARGIICDLTDPDAVDAFAEATLREFGRVNLVCPCTGGANGGGTIDTVSLADLRRLFETNLFGVFNVVGALLPGLRTAAREGEPAALLIAGSDHALAVPLDAPPAIAYTSAMHALLGFAGCCRRDLADEGVRVGLACPAWVRTEKLEQLAAKSPEVRSVLARLGQDPAEVARLAFAGLARGQFLIPTNPASRTDALQAARGILDALELLPQAAAPAQQAMPDAPERLEPAARSATQAP